MQLDLQEKFHSDKKMKEYLKLNSHWYKQLNRDPNFYKEFETQMKEKYKLRVTDKIEGFIDNIDVVSNVLNILK